jgi:molecular chaperone GrpE
VIDITGEASSDDPTVELDLLRAERDELRDRMLRALADAENSRKRAERDRREAEQYGGSKLARDLLPVYDNLRRALDAAGEEQRAAANGVIEGVELTLRELAVGVQQARDDARRARGRRNLRPAAAPGHVRSAGAGHQGG